MFLFQNVLDWAAGSDRPLGECQGFVGNDMIPEFGGTMNRYYEYAWDAAMDSDLTQEWPGVPAWAFFGTGRPGHVGYGTPDQVLSDISGNEVVLGGPTRNIGTSSLARLRARGFKFVGWSLTNGKNTMPTPRLTPPLIEGNDVYISVVNGDLAGNHYWMLPTGPVWLHPDIVKARNEAHAAAGTPAVWLEFSSDWFRVFSRQVKGVEDKDGNPTAATFPDVATITGTLAADGTLAATVQAVK